jgi:hypothetical protein
MDGVPGWDIQLHSEARPSVFVTFTKSTPKYGTLLTQIAYARNLKRQVAQCAARGIRVNGHSVHGIHQYLDVDSEWSWSVIEWATWSSTLCWIASSRGVYERCPVDPRPVLPPYAYETAAKRLVVFPSAFDDGFFHRWWEDRLLGVARRSEAHAQEVLARQAEACIARGIPLVVNFHPCWWFTGRADGSAAAPVYSFGLIEWLVDFFRRRGLEVLTLSALYERIAAATVNGAVDALAG